MDPVGPWTYSYNNISGSTSVQPSRTSSGTDFHQSQITVASRAQNDHTSVVSAASSSNSPILLQTVSSTAENYNSDRDFGYDINPIYHKAENVKGTICSSTNASVLSQVGSDSGLHLKVENREDNYVNYQIPSSRAESAANTYYVQQQTVEIGSSKSGQSNVGNHNQSVWSGQADDNSINAHSLPLEILTHATVSAGDMSTIAQNPPRTSITKASLISYETLNEAHFSNPQPSNTTRITKHRSATSTKNVQQQSGSPLVSLSVASVGSNANSNQYYRSPITVTPYTDSTAQTSSSNYGSSKSYPVISSSNLNPTCILVTTSPGSQAGASASNTSTKEYRSYACPKSPGKSTAYSVTSSRNNIEKISRSSTLTTSPVSLVSNVSDNTNTNYGIPATMTIAGQKGQNQSLQIVQTKAQTKIYPEVVVLEEYDRTKLGDIQQTDTHDSSIGYCTIIDGRLYAAGGANIILNENPKSSRGTMNSQHVTRHYVVSDHSEYVSADNNNRAKISSSEQQYAGTVLQNDGTSAIIVPRRQSPSHSAQIPSPAYPVYTNSMNAIESPSQQGTANHSSIDNSGHIVIYKTNTAQPSTSSHSGLDVTVSRNSNNLTTNNSVVYSSVITRALVNDQNKLYSTPQQYWEGGEKTKKYYSLKGDHNEVVVPAEIQIKQTYYEPPTHNTHLGALANLKTENPVTENILVTTDHPLISQIELAAAKMEEQQNMSVPIPISTPVVVRQTPAKQGRRRKNQTASKTREQLLSENEFLINRQPSSGHVINSATDQVISLQENSSTHQENGSTYFEYGKWNTNSANVAKATNYSSTILNAEPSISVIPAQTTNYPNTLMVAHSGSSTEHISQISSPYCPTIHIANTPAPITSVNETSVNNSQPAATGRVEVEKHLNNQNSDSLANTISNGQDNVEMQPVDDQKSKVIVPNIEEELGFLSKAPFPVKSEPTFGTFGDKKIGATSSIGSNFMSSYLKFLEGGRESSPPPMNKVNKKTTWQRTYVVNPPQTKSTMAQSATTTQTPTTSQSSMKTQSSPSNNSMTSVPQQTETDNFQTSQFPVPKSNENQNVAQIQQVQTQQLSIESSDHKRKLDATELETKKNRYRSKKQEAMNDTKALTSPLPKKARPQMAMQMHSMANEIINQQTSVSVANEIHTTPSTTASAILLSNKTVDSLATNSNFVLNSVQQQQHHHPQTTFEVIKDSNRAQTATTYPFHQQNNEDPLNLPPRRETSVRKAKTRSIDEIMHKKALFYNDDQDETRDFVDSDNDPVWTPEEENQHEDKKGPKRKTRRQVKNVSRSRNTKSNILTAAVMDAGIDETFAGLDDENANEIQKKKEVNPVRTGPATPTNISNTMPAVGGKTTHKNSSHSNTNVFRTGDFVVIRTDLLNDWPSIWQVDGKAVLQKYEPFKQNEKIYYKNLSTYAALTLDSRKLYIKAPVQIISQTPTETILELKRHELLTKDSEQFIQKIIQDFAIYRDNFDIYLQTLISHSLDANFFDEIEREQDEYFLPHIKVIDNLREECRRKILTATPHIRAVADYIDTWPNCNITTDRKTTAGSAICKMCQVYEATIEIILFGPPYDRATLQSINLPDGENEKELLLCHDCTSSVKVYHKLAHEKYRLFYECSTKVNERHTNHNEDPAKAMMQVLKDLLAESTWVEQLFYSMRYTWAEVYSLEREIRFRQIAQS